MMTPFSDIDLEERIAAVRNSLLQHPSSLDELIPLLNQIEELLSKVQQSPCKSMQAALSPLMKALVVEELVKHSDIDVKVGIASCLSEIIRITAPDAPYDDDKLKDIFQLIVSSFQNLSDTSSGNHERRITILETMANVRSCLIMLDLECYHMIIEMFQHFIRAIEVYHTEFIFASMETIMTLVLKESEAIPPNLLIQILAILKRGSEAVMPVANKLSMRIIRNCGDKITPCLTKAVETLDAYSDVYIDVLVPVSRENCVTTWCSKENILEGKLVIEEAPLSSSTIQEQVANGGIEEANFQENQPSVISQNPIDKNDINETGTKETKSDSKYQKQADFDHHDNVRVMSKTKLEDLSGQELVELGAILEDEEAENVPYIVQFDDHYSRSPYKHMRKKFKLSLGDKAVFKGGGIVVKRRSTLLF